MILKYVQFLNEDIDVVNITHDELKKMIDDGSIKSDYLNEIGQEFYSDSFYRALDTMTDGKWHFKGSNELWIDTERITKRILSNYRSSDKKKKTVIQNMINGLRNYITIPQHPKYDIVESLVQDMIEESNFPMKLAKLERTYRGSFPYRVLYSVSINFSLEIRKVDNRDFDKLKKNLEEYDISCEDMEHDYTDDKKSRLVNFIFEEKY
jgi:hypothetical protein